jgi:hypothetical protein
VAVVLRARTDRGTNNTCTLRTQPEGIRDVYGIPARVPVEVEPPGEADGVFLGEDPIRTRSYGLSSISLYALFL